MEKTFLVEFSQRIEKPTKIGKTTKIEKPTTTRVEIEIVPNEI